MCTSLTLPTPDGRHLFGRTLDLDDHFGESVTFTPRRYPFAFNDCYPHTQHYALLGMATVADSSAASGYPLYAEAMNEKGLCMAGLRFAKNAAYAPVPRTGFLNLAPWELIPYLLGTCATVAEARAALRDICIVDKPFSDVVGTAPLHWHIADADPTHGGLILETTAEGMRIYDDSPDGAGVLANAPPYPDQLIALGDCYVPWGDMPGLPGDYSSISRFIRAATLRRWWMEQMARGEVSDAGKDYEDCAVAEFFRMLGAVSPPQGAIRTPEGRYQRTLYTCCMDTSAGVYHYTTGGNMRARTVAFVGLDLNGEKVLLLTDFSEK